jgi:DNA modification methylase
MHIPETIPFDQVIVGERGRTTYSRIEDLAQSITDNGMIQPIVLVPLWENDNDGNIPTFKGYGLDAGGRRYQALKMLETKFLYHATTCDPDRPGFVLKGEDQNEPLQRLMTEIAENLDREDLDWRDEVKLLTKAYRMSELKANAEGKHILMRDFGAAIGHSYADLQAACAVHDDLIMNPERYKECTGYRAAYSVMLKENAKWLESQAAAKSIQRIPLSTKIEVPAQIEPKPSEPPQLTVPLTESFFNINAIDFMREMPNERFDHIITDPDYAVSRERLSASLNDPSEGVLQETIEHSLDDMRRFMKEAWRVTKPQSFLIFWYDPDHHEKLQRMAIDVGYAVQRWPLVWFKTDYRSNAAPAHNFCKNLEFAMVCRKPTAVLAKVQMSSIYQCATGEVTRELGHPFAKPYEVWQWLYSAVCIKGQVVYDPFVGRGSSSIASIRWGLRPVGTEAVSEHYHGLLLNLQKEFKRQLGSNVAFT